MGTIVDGGGSGRNRLDPSNFHEAINIHSKKERTEFTARAYIPKLIHVMED